MTKQKSMQSLVVTNLHSTYPYNFIEAVYGTKFEDIIGAEVEFNTKYLESLTPIGALFLIRDAYSYDERSLIEARFRDGKSYAEIGDMLGTTYNQAKTAVEKALRKARNPVFTEKYRVCAVSLYKTEHESRVELASELYHIRRLKENADLLDLSIGRKTDIGELGLSQRTVNCLRRHSVQTVEELLTERFPDVNSYYELSGIGILSVTEIVDRVHACGQKFYWERSKV